MGRPKKWRSAETALDTSWNVPPASTHAPVTAQEEPVMTVPVAAMVIDPASLIDPTLSAADLDFLNLLGPDSVSTQPYQAQPPGLKDGQGIWNFDINFDSHSPPPDGTETASTQYPLGPGPSTPTPPSQEPSPPELAPLRPNSCSCLANLYLALDSLARLPTELGPAICLARSASKAAHEAIQCRVCSPPLTETMKVPIATFQNTLILGALLPSIADAYQNILDMVEAETARGICEQRQLQFTLPEFGGVWGQLEASTHACGATFRYADEWMQPAMWRLLVRALLKTDVYGISSESRNGKRSCLPFPHMGLRDVVAQMDERSRTRHAEIDALIEAGLPAPTGPTGMTVRHSSKLHGGEQPHCRQIIRIAREAVDRLVIP